MAIYTDGLDDFYPYGGDGHLTCPDGWIPVWHHDEQAGVLDRPEFKKAGADQTRTAPGAAAIHSAFSTVNGALRQSFNVGIGESMTAGVYVRKEAVEGDSGIQIGIDPTGQGVINKDRIVWSEWYSVNSPDWKPMAWRLREVQAVAQSNIVTVFLRHKNDNPVQAHAHFDDFTLTTSGVVPPEPPKPPIEGTLGELLDELESCVGELRAYVDTSAVDQRVLIVSGAAADMGRL